MKINLPLQILAISLMIFVLPACGTPSGGPQILFDHPLDDTIVPMAPPTIQAQASD